MIRTPSAKTLAKYGLTEAEYRDFVDRQKGVCPVCELEPSTGRLCIDHLHIKGWKKMPPESRKLYVRGLLCFWCNSRHLGRGVTAQKLRNGAEYLDAFEGRLRGAG